MVCWLEPSVQVWVSKKQTGFRSDFGNWFGNWIWFRFGLVKTKLESGLILGTGFGFSMVFKFGKKLNSHQGNHWFFPGYFTNPMVL